MLVVKSFTNATNVVAKSYCGEYDYNEKRNGLDKSQMERIETIARKTNKFTGTRYHLISFETVNIKEDSYYILRIGFETVKLDEKTDDNVTYNHYIAAGISKEIQNNKVYLLNTSKEEITDQWMNKRAKKELFKMVIRKEEEYQQ